MLILSVGADELVNDDVLVDAADLPWSINNSIPWGDVSDAINGSEQVYILSEDGKLTLDNGDGKTSFTFLSESPFIQLNAEDIVDFKLR